MPKTKQEKQKILDQLREKVEKQKAIVLVSFRGLKTKDFSILRTKLKETGNELKVTKKTLLQLVFNEKGFQMDLKKIKDEIALVFGYQDEILPAKIVWQFSQENPNLKILGGFLENKFFDSEKVIEFAKLPTKEELLGKLVKTVSAPLENFVYVLKANLQNFIYLLTQIKGQS